MTDVVSPDETNVEIGIDTNGFQQSFIPDHFRVTSQLSMLSQTVGVEYEELQDYFQWIQEQAKTRPGLDLIERSAALTINNLEPGEQEWEDIVLSGQDENYTLGRCIREKVNSCFQRAVFFNLLMQQLGIPSQVLQGRWIESQRSNLAEGIEGRELLYMLADGSKVLTEEKTENHLWNVIQLGDKRYLIDTSNLVDKPGEKKKQPVIQEIPAQTEKHLTVNLPSGQTRHYIIDSVLAPKPTSIAS